MKKILPVFIILLSGGAVAGQTAITAVNTFNTASAPATTYTNAGITYNWAVAPNNTTTTVAGFTAGGLNYSYAAFLNGTVKLRRVNNASVSGNFTLVWAETVTNGSIYNMLPAYQNDMEAFFDNRIYNQGTDNFFDNTSSNSNNIERLDWILSGGYATPSPAQVGFAIFERGAAGAHDPFCIAAITSLDGLGNPASYGNIVRVAGTSYGEPGPNVTYRILKAANPGNLLDATSNTQSRGGVIVSLQNLGIAANTTIYGYSLFSNDLPVSATPANLVDFTNTTYFPTNTGNPGGIDLIAVTGLYIENLLLPANFLSLAAVEHNSQVRLGWQCANETAVKNFEVQRSDDGVAFSSIATVTKNNRGAYEITDDVQAATGSALYYRVQQNEISGAVIHSNTVLVKRKAGRETLLLYPSPVKNTVYVQVYSATPCNSSLLISNAAGRVMLRKAVTLQAGSNTFAVTEVKNLTAGSYVLTVSGGPLQASSRQFTKL